MRRLNSKQIGYTKRSNGGYTQHYFLARKSSAGYIALTSAIIIGAILMVITINQSISGFLSRFNVLGIEFKKISSELAEACVDTAALRLSKDPDYAGGETLVVGDESCTIGSIVVGATPEERIVTTSGSFGNLRTAFTNFRVALNLSGVLGSPITIPLPPGAVCADTLMMLDRTGSMDTSSLSDERDAASGMLTLYETVDPKPFVGVGLFGINDGMNLWPATIIGAMTVDYNSLRTIIDTDARLQTPAGSTNLHSAISEGHDELKNNGSSDPSVENILVLISDGNPTRPTDIATAKAEAATAASLAKSEDTEIYAIHFGDGSGIEFLSSLASVSTVDSSEDTGLLTPVDFLNSGWASPGSVFASDDNRSVANAGTDVVRYYGFTFSIPPDAKITGIEITLEGYTTISRQANVDISWNDGSTYTSGSGGDKLTNMPTSLDGLAEAPRSFGGVWDEWNRGWTPEELNHFRVRIDADAGVGNLNIDYIQARVYYMTQAQIDAENADGDHFYISPTSDQLADLFDDIAENECPFVALPTGSPPILDVSGWEELPDL